MADLFDILLAKNLAGGGVQPQGEIEITENGEYDVAEYASASVNVALGGAKANVNTLPTIVASVGITPTATITIREE